MPPACRSTPRRQKNSPTMCVRSSRSRTESSTRERTREHRKSATGTTILLVEEGSLTAPQMFKKAQDANTFMTWLIRLGGFFLMFLGIFMLFRPIVVFADVVPLFGTMLGAGIGLFAFLGAAILSFLTIAIAWVFYRPFIGITMLVLAAAAFYWLLSVGMKKKAARAAAMVPSPA